MMSVERLIQRLAEYEARRSIRWLLIIAALWIASWGVNALFFSRSWEEAPLSEVELLAEEAQFYPIDL